MIKSTLFMVMQYNEYFDINEAIRNLEDKAWKYAVGKHDKDGDNLHYHIVIQTPTSTTLQSIAKTCGVEPQYVEPGKTSVKWCCGYLVHANDPEKVQYTYQEAVIIDKIGADRYIKEVKEYAQRSVYDLIKMVDRDELTEYNYNQILTTLEYTKYRRHLESAFKFRNDKMQEVDRKMECWFVNGKSGAGKTLFAKSLAKNLKMSIYITSNGKNPFDDYKGQEVIILDDCRPSDFKFNDFLKLTDNNTQSMVGCRFYNKSLWRCKLMIVTSTMPLEDWYKNLQESDDEAVEQLTRRFGRKILVTRIDKKAGCVIAVDDDDNRWKVVIPNYEPPKPIIDISRFLHREPRQTSILEPIDDNTNPDDIF